MNIINLSSSIEITPAQISFCEELCENGDNNTEKDSYYWLLNHLHIFLVNEANFVKYVQEYEDKSSGDKPSTDWLGYYTRLDCPPFSNTPIIVICPERIEKCVTNDDEFTWLFAKVMIHELSHAKLDFNNENNAYVSTSEDPFYYTWMEESIANMMTLGLFDTVVDRGDWYQKASAFAKDFVTKQPPKYAFGGWLYANLSFNGLKWREVKTRPDRLLCVKKPWNDYVRSCTKKEYKYRVIRFFLVQMGICDLELQDEQQCENISIEEDTTDMSFMFCGCSSLTEIPKLDTSNVTDMNYMFGGCFSIINISDILKYKIPEDYQEIFGIKEIDDLINKYKNRPQDKFKMIKELKLIDKKYM